MGVSGFEPRTLAFLAAAIRELKTRLRVYWLFYRDSEPDAVEKESPERWVRSTLPFTLR